MAVLLVGGADSAKQQPGARIVPVSATASPNATFEYDAAAEQELLDLANAARKDAGLSPLASDDGLAKAARTHAAEMAAQQQLSHQFADEAGLAQRLAATSDLHLDRAGENVSYAGNAAQAEDGLMHSPPHRANLLNADFNVAGFGVVRSGGLLYVTQDFGRSLPTYSADQTASAISAAIAQMRLSAGLKPLRQVEATGVQNAACAMAQADTLKSGGTVAGRAILRYTTMQPGTLPAGATKALSDPTLQSFSLGACYGRSGTYPNGVYWVVLSLN